VDVANVSNGDTTTLL